jgi:hypothetical protein
MPDSYPADEMARLQVAFGQRRISRLKRLRASYGHPFFCMALKRIVVRMGRDSCVGPRGQSAYDIVAHCDPELAEVFSKMRVGDNDIWKEFRADVQRVQRDAAYEARSLHKVPDSEKRRLELTRIACGDEAYGVTWETIWRPRVTLAESGIDIVDVDIPDDDDGGRETKLTPKPEPEPESDEEQGLRP